MTIEEKAKRYDEALEIARDSFTYPDYPGFIRADVVFPELKESKDERIRKDIIRILKGEISYTSKEENEKYITWLEKQGTKEVDPRYENLEELLDADTIYQMAMNEAMVEEAKSKAINALSELQISKLLGIEKQGKQKDVDKVEPKFKVGDWCIDNEDATIFQIVKVLDNTYTYKTNEGSVYSCTHYSLENDARLWTIQDAKPGDVLAWNDSRCIAIFKNIYDEESFNSYGFVGHCTGKFESGQFYHNIEGAHPATKEQRDTLMQAMTNAGWQFDFEKKELKKIE